MLAAVTQSPLEPVDPTNTTTITSNETTAIPTVSLPDCFPCWWQGISFFIQNLLIFLRYRYTC